MKICILADFCPNSGAGGVEYYTLSLIKALGSLTDGNEEYVIIGNNQEYEWLKEYTGINQKVISDRTSVNRKVSFLHKKYRILKKTITKYLIDQNNVRNKFVYVSDGFLESLNCDLVHFPYQEFSITSLPSIFNPHDLQHKHFPQFFTPYQIYAREELYSLAMSYCTKIAVGSSWVKKDIVRNYNIHPDKIQVIPCAAPVSTENNLHNHDMESVKKLYNLPDKFIYYPAMTWEHKNHIRLLRALKQISDNDAIKINLVCTGKKVDNYWQIINNEIAKLNLTDQVKFLDIIPLKHVKEIYRLSEFVVVPTLFEAESGPVFESWNEGKPVICSNVTSLPEQAGNAALMFNPYSIEEIANAIKQLYIDNNIKKELIENGKKRGREFSWYKTAKAYRALYRKVLKCDLSLDDQNLLLHDWMKSK